MNIENRSDGNYIVTGATTDKNESITIKLDSELDSQTITCSSGIGIDAEITLINMSWKLKHDDENGLYIELKAEDRSSDYYKEICNIDDDLCINELVSMVQNKGTLEDCEEIQKIIHQAYNQIFYRYLEDNKTLHSNMIVNGIVEVKDQNRVLGHGTRFILENNKIIVCEYAGKSVPRNILPQINIYINDNYLTYEAVEYNYNEHREIGYMAYDVSRSAIINRGEKQLEYPKLITPHYYSDSDSMIEYIKQHNSPEDIVKYKIALKGKVEILNIDEYMVNEFLI